jgi:pyruvate/2-oxoglutarate dehydrogenase complex dihydrolipoamide acyltransferase (E2) component
VLNYGVIGADGTVAVRIMYDHRVLDGATVARVLARIEEKLGSEILQELTAMQQPAA